MTPTASPLWWRILVVLLALVVVGCSAGGSGGGSGAMLLRYERDWPDRYHEELTLTDDGHVTMKHGDVLERMTLTGGEVQRLRDALARGIPEGDQGDSLVRTLVVANGTSHAPVKPAEGSVVELLERLMTTHSLDDTSSPMGS